MPLTLHKRGAIWHIRGTVAGQRIRESTGLGRKSDAEIYRARREAEILQCHTHGRGPRLTFAQAALTYLEANGEGRFLAPLLDYFGPDTLLSEVDNAAVNRAAQKLYPDRAASTINRQLVTPISAVINLAADEGLCPPRRLRRRKEPAGRMRWLTPEEGDRLLDACDARILPPVAFFLGSGCRTGEGFALDRSDLYLDTGEAWIQDTKSGVPRMVRFPDRTRRTLATHGLPEDGAVFRTPKGQPYKIRANGGGQMAEAFNAARDAAKLGPEVTPHVLRHTWATWHYAQNRDVLRLMTLGGWAKPDMALRYAKMAPGDLGDRVLAAGWDLQDDTKLAQAPAPVPVKPLKSVRK